MTILVYPKSTQEEAFEFILATFPYNVIRTCDDCAAGFTIEQKDLLTPYRTRLMKADETVTRWHVKKGEPVYDIRWEVICPKCKTTMRLGRQASLAKVDAYFNTEEVKPKRCFLVRFFSGI